MMDYCSSITDKLSSYIDGYLNQEERAEVRAHLENCPKCKEQHDQLVKLTDSLQSMPKLSTSEDFEEKLWQKINATKKSNVVNFTTQKQKKNFFKILNNGMVYVAGIAAAAIGFLVVNQTGVFEFNNNEITPKIQMNKMIAESKEDLNKNADDDTLKVIKKQRNPDDMIHRVSDEIDE